MVKPFHKTTYHTAGVQPMPTAHPEQCPHTEFGANVEVIRQETSKGVLYNASVRMLCQKCGIPFIFDIVNLSDIQITSEKSTILLPVKPMSVPVVSDLMKKQIMKTVTTTTKPPFTVN